MFENKRRCEHTYLIISRGFAIIYTTYAIILCGFVLVSIGGYPVGMAFGQASSVNPNATTGICVFCHTI